MIRVIVELLKQQRNTHDQIRRSKNPPRVHCPHGASPNALHGQTGAGGAGPFTEEGVNEHADFMSKTVITELEAFAEYFGTATCFWTSEDGCRTDVVTMRDMEDGPLDEHVARMRMFEEFWHLKGVDWSKPLVRAFVAWLPADSEWWDHNEAPKDTYLWQFTDKPGYSVWRLKL